LGGFVLDFEIECAIEQKATNNTAMNTNHIRPKVRENIKVA
jgi:hypothetical protein